MKIIYSLLLPAIFATTAFAQTDNLGNSTGKNISATVSYSGFDASQNGNAVVLTWTSVDENNMQYHEIQKSANGSSFTPAGSLTAQNNVTPFRYSFTDATPVEGNNYYRVLSFDKFGNTLYSNVLKINNSYRKTDIAVLSNPIRNGVLNLQLSNFNGSRYLISLYSNSGTQVFARSFSFTDGSATETINLPQNLARGSYFLQVSNGDSRINKQVILQ